MGEEYLGMVKSFTTEEKPVLSIITGEAADMTETSVVLNGYSSIPFADLGSLTVGFIYSTASEPSLSNGTNVISEEFLSDTQFFVSISGLKPDTKYYYRSYLLQNGMYLYGSVSSFSTEKINAVVTTNSPQGVLEHSATISGHLSLTSLSNLKSEVALYYSHLYTTQADLFSKGTRLPESALSVSKDGTFSIDLTNLPHSYSYAYMAYANIEGVDFFGEILQFKTKDIEADIQTGDASNISEHKATISGRFSLKSSTSSKPSVYFFYSDQYSSPDLLKTRGNKALITSIPSDGSFSKNLTDLSYATTYYYMVYVEVEDVQFYGEVRSFNTSGIEASITTLNATNVTEHKATLSGNFVNRTVDHLNANVALFYSPTISDKDGLARSGKKMIVSSSSIKSNGDFSCDLSNLSHSTTYYYVAYAKIEDVELFGEVESFSTRTVSGTATTGDARDISEHKATITGTVVSNTIETISTSVSVYYSPTLKTKNELVKSGDKMSVSSLDSDGDFSCKLLNLSHSTTYYYVTFAKIEDVEILGDVKSFSTRGISGTATTGTATDITEHKATISGSFVLNSVESLQSEVYLYYSSTAKTESELKTTGTSIKVTNLSSNGQISVNLENLAHSTTYYYMISSSVEGVCFDGEIKRFITTAINATVTTGAASDVDEFSAKITGGFLASNSSLRHGVYVVYGENLTSREKLMNSGTRVEISNVSSDGSFTKGITNLKHSTKYYYIVYAFIEDVDFYGDVKYLTTESFDVTLETGNTDDLKEFSASLGGVFTVNSSYNLETYVAMYLSESDVSGSDFKSKGTTYEVKSVSFDGTFEVNIGNLQQGKTYYYAAYAKVNNVEYWGGTKSFTTPTIKVSLSCEVSDYGEYWVTVSGAFSLESIETIASRVLFYYAKDADTISDLKKNSTPIEIPAEDYSFEKMITGLQSSTSYSFALCAIVLGEEYWSDVAQCVTVKVPTGYEALGLNVYWAKNNSNCGYLSWESASGYTQLPSRSDWYELIHNCSWVWDSSNYGFTIISNVKGYEGKSIFLPAGGYRDSSSGTLYYNNVECLYWTSYERDSECAYYMRATSSVSPNTNFYNNKAIRFPVRGVCAKE